MHPTPLRAALTPLTTLKHLSAALMLVGLSACGGGGSGDTADSTTPTYKGTVTAFSGPTSFSVDGIPVDASGSNATPEGIRKGTRVEIQGDMVDGHLVARRVELDDDNPSDDHNTDPNELEGRVTAYTSPTSFSVDGIPVDASATPTTLSPGMRVEVHGTMSNGVMVADRLKIEDQSATDDHADDSSDDADEANESEHPSAEAEDDHGADSSDDDDTESEDDTCDTKAKSGCEDDHKRG